MSVAECPDCDEIAAGDSALAWAMHHAHSTGHKPICHEPI